MRVLESLARELDLLAERLRAVAAAAGGPQDRLTPGLRKLIEDAERRQAACCLSHFLERAESDLDPRALGAALRARGWIRGMRARRVPCPWGGEPKIGSIWAPPLLTLRALEEVEDEQ